MVVRWGSENDLIDPTVAVRLAVGAVRAHLRHAGCGHGTAPEGAPWCPACGLALIDPALPRLVPLLGFGAVELSNRPLDKPGQSVQLRTISYRPRIVSLSGEASSFESPNWLHNQSAGPCARAATNASLATNRRNSCKSAVESTGPMLVAPSIAPFTVVSKADIAIHRSSISGEWPWGNGPGRSTASAPHRSLTMRSVSFPAVTPFHHLSRGREQHGPLPLRDETTQHLASRTP